MRVYSFTVLICFILSSTDLFASEGRFYCQVTADQANALFCINPGGGSASGKVDFDFYDENGRPILSNAFCVGVAVAVNSCKKICHVKTPKGAAFCEAYIDD